MSLPFSSSPALPLLSVAGLTRHFPARGGGRVVRAVDEVSFTVRAGETLALVGESGCGKSTTARLILRLLEPTGGTIHFEAEDVARMDAQRLLAYRRQAQIIFQDPFSSLNPRMTVEQIIAEPLVVHRQGNRAQVRARARELLQRVGLAAEHAERHPHEFSGGQRQRIGIARALALNPQLIVCDEPLSALDVSVQAQIINLLGDLQQQLGMAYLFISHNLAVVRHLAHRVAVMYLGRIVELGARDQVFSSPRHPYTQALLSAVPVPDPHHARARITLRGDAAHLPNLFAGCRFQPRCLVAQALCCREAPSLIATDAPAGNDGHAAACHLANQHPQFMREREDALSSGANLAVG